MSGKVNNRPVVAAFSMLGAMMILGFIDNFVAVIFGDISLWQFQVLRSLAMVPLVVGMSLAGLGSLRPRRWRPVLARAVMITCSMMLYFASLGIMPISQALAGLFTSPIFVLLIKVIVMCQPIGLWRGGAVLMGFAGILLVLQPGGQGFGPLMLLPVAAGFFYAISAIATRSWGQGESALAMLGTNKAMLGLMRVLMASPVGGPIPLGDGFMTRSWTWELAPVLPWIALQAVGSVTGVFLIIRAYQMDEPTNVAVFEYSVMVFAPFFAWLLFAQTLGAWQAIGIVLIASAGVIIALRST